MEKIKLKGSGLNLSTQLNLITLNDSINILPKKDEILFSRKIFLEVIMGLIKKAQNDCLVKSKSFNWKNYIDLIKTILMRLLNNLEEIKEEKEIKIKVFQIQKDQKILKLKDKMMNTDFKKRRRINSEILSTSAFKDNDSDDFIFNNFNGENDDFKTKNFILENKILEVENKIARIKYLIAFDKIPHKLEDHFIEYININKKDKQQNVTNNFHDRLLNVRGMWKDIANKKNVQDMRLENIRTRIKYLKNGNEIYITKKIKYINTEDAIPEENNENDNFLEENQEPKKEEKNNNEQNFKLNFDDVAKKNIKLELKEVEKLLKMKNMNINVNINLNQQYINNHFNNYAHQ